MPKNEGGWDILEIRLVDDSLYQRSALSEIRFVLAPVQDAFAHDVVEADGDKAEVDEHLPEAEETGAPVSAEGGDR